MSRKIKKRPTPPWLTGKAYHWDGNKAMQPWVKLDRTLLQDPTFQALTPITKLVYLSMCLEMGDHFGEWFTFPAGTAEKYGFNQRTLQRAADHLRDAGFIISRRPLTGWKNETFAPTEDQIVTKWKQ